jgi:hypothetical protein
VNATWGSCSRRWLPVLLLCLMPAVARAERVLMLPASGAGVSAEIIQSTRALFVSRLAPRDPRLLIVDMERAPTPEPPPLEQVMSMGLHAQAQAAIQLDLRRDSGTTWLTVTGLGVPTGEQLFQFRHGTPAGPEILPALVELAVARSLSRQGSPPAAPPEPRRTFLGARAGIKIPRETPGATDTALFGMGIFVVEEFSRVFVEIGVSHNSADRGDNDDRGNVTSFGLGAYLPFVIEPTAPYLGASLRWQHSRFGGQGADGFVISPALGWSWRRKDSLGFRVEGGAFYNLYEERKVDRLIPGSAEPVRSYGFELWVATWL